MITINKVIEIFCSTDEFCKNLEVELSKNLQIAPSNQEKRKRNRKGAMKNTAGVCPAVGDAKSPKSDFHVGGLHNQCKKGEKQLFLSLRLITFVLKMYKQLISKQRYTISVLLQRKESLTSIANTIEVHPSTISREVKRNLDKHGVYSPEKAQTKAKARKKKKRGNRALKNKIRCEVFALIRQQDWSPEQVSY